MSQVAQPDKTSRPAASTAAILALRLAFIAAAPGILTGILWNMANITATRYIQVFLYLPAAILGIRAWWQGRSFARSAPVVACLLVAWIGYAYAAPRTTAGLEFLAQISLLLPISALIVETGAWMLCARTFIYANAFVLSMIFWVEFQKQGWSLLLGLHRFGLLVEEEGTRMIANPNSVGGQFAVAAVLAMGLYLRSGTPRAQRLGGRRAKGIGFGWSLLYMIVCVQTASRSALTGMMAGLAALFIGGTKGQRPSRVRDLLMLSTLAGAMLLLFSAVGVFNPWGMLTSRLENVNNVVSCGGRTVIWGNAYRAWRSDPMITCFGTGTGLAEQLLGEFDDDAALNEMGVLERSTHSAYIEWMLSFGLFGAIPGLWLMITMWRRARLLDRKDRGAVRQAILLCVCLWGAASPVYRHPCFPAPGTLVLAMLSDRPGSQKKRRPAKSKTAPASSGVPPFVVTRFIESSAESTDSRPNERGRREREASEPHKCSYYERGAEQPRETTR